MSEFKSGFVAIVGRPNTGKSTLLNAIIGEKLAIVSNKPQTTRNAILTIKTTEDYQLIFVDTPGVHRPKTKLGEHMIKAVTDAMTDVDAAILVCDATKEIGTQEKEIIQQLISRKIPAVLAINKVDRVSKEDLLPLIDAYMGLYEFSAVVPMAALHRRGTDDVIEEVLSLMPEGPMYYPADQITDQPEKQIASEVLREKMLRLLDREVPHGIAVEIEKFIDEDDLLTIEAAIICEKATHKAIIIGKNGEMIKRIGSYARADLEKFFDKKVFLKTWVKVRQDWRNKEKSIRELGY